MMKTLSIVALMQLLDDDHPVMNLDATGKVIALRRCATS